MINILLSQITNPVLNGGLQNVAGNAGADAAPKFAGFIAMILKIGLVMAAIMSLVYLLWGGVDWIVSGGDKGNVEAARNKITHAILGLAITALLIAVVQFVGGFLQINILDLKLPTASDIP